MEGQIGAKVWNGRQGCDGEMDGEKKEKRSHFHIKSLSIQVDHFHPWPFGSGSQQSALIFKPRKFMEMTGPVWT